MNRDREKEIIREEEEGKGNREVRRGVGGQGRNHSCLTLCLTSLNLILEMDPLSIYRFSNVNYQQNH